MRQRRRLQPGRHARDGRKLELVPGTLKALGPHVVCFAFAAALDAAAAAGRGYGYMDTLYEAQRGVSLEATRRDVAVAYLTPNATFVQYVQELEVGSPLAGT